MFELVSSYAPAGDQPQAIEQLTAGLQAGARHQTLLGVTGSGKTFTVANVIARLNRPALIISHNKTLAAQLYSEFRAFFPRNAVEFFISYFDYYQPEAYLPRTDTYIEKDSSINEQIERLRLSTMSALFSRRDVIVVASVSCIYGIGSKEDYESMLVSLRAGDAIGRDTLLSRLVDLQYARNDVAFQPGQFRVRGDTVELRPSYMDEALRLEFFGEEVERITRFDPLTGRALGEQEGVTIYPSKQFVTPPDKLKRAILSIREELGERIAWFEKEHKLLEAQRIKMRTEYDLEMMEQMGYCSGIENYSRHIAGRQPGSRPATVLDFFPQDSLLVIDESHVTVPQIGGMYEGDRSRKTVLVDHGFRLPSAMDNRPLRFPEFQAMQGQTLYVSATPGPREIAWSRESAMGRPLPLGACPPSAIAVLSPDQRPDGSAAPAASHVRSGVVELIVRPTGLVDPKVTLKPLQGQIDDLIHECRKRADAKERVLVTTLTKRTAEELTDYLKEIGVNIRYLHSEIDALERVEILRALRKGDFDVLVGINLLREGLDLPEVSLVAILDADKEGFLRSETSLIQTAGRAARHLHGEVILYADVRTQSIERFLAVTTYRRQKQLEYNVKHGITPRSVRRAVEESLSSCKERSFKTLSMIQEVEGKVDVTDTLQELDNEMHEASKNLEFEKAALLRDQILELKRQYGMMKPDGATAGSKTQPEKSRAKGKRYR